APNSGFNPDAILDPEIAPYMSDEDDTPHDVWPSNPPNLIGLISPILIHGRSESVGSASAPMTPAASEYNGSDDETLEYSKSKTSLRMQRKDDIREMFNKDKTANSRRRSITGGRPVRRKTRGTMMRQVNVLDESTWHSPIDPRPSSPYYNAGNHFLSNRHRRAVSAPPNVELNAASIQHMRLLLRQLFAQYEIEESEEWEKVIMK